MKPTINQVAEHIAAHPSISAKELAAHFGYSHYHFGRWFGTHMGVSLRDYLSAQKINRGIDALSKGDKVIDSQLEAGYQSAGSFTQVFKSFSGITPKKHGSSIAKFAKKVAHMHATQASAALFARSIYYQSYNPKEHRQAHALTLHVHNQTLQNSLLFIALFPQALPKGTPVLGICSSTPEHSIVAIPSGRYYTMVVELNIAFSQGYDIAKLLTLEGAKRDIVRTPVVFPLAKPMRINLHLRQKVAEDPPINLHPLKLLFDVLKL